MAESTIGVVVKMSRLFLFRMRLGMAILRLGCRILPIGVSVDIEGENGR